MSQDGDIMTIDDEEYITFQVSCLKIGLQVDDEEKNEESSIGLALSCERSSTPSCSTDAC